MGLSSDDVGGPLDRFLFPPEVIIRPTPCTLFDYIFIQRLLQPFPNINIASAAPATTADSTPTVDLNAHGDAVADQATGNVQHVLHRHSCLKGRNHIATSYICSSSSLSDPQVDRRCKGIRHLRNERNKLNFSGMKIGNKCTLGDTSVHTVESSSFTAGCGLIDHSKAHCKAIVPEFDGTGRVCNRNGDPDLSHAWASFRALTIRNQA